MMFSRNEWPVFDLMILIAWRRLFRYLLWSFIVYENLICSIYIDRIQLYYVDCAWTNGPMSLHVIIINSNLILNNLVIISLWCMGNFSFSQWMSECIGHGRCCRGRGFCPTPCRSSITFHDLSIDLHFYGAYTIYMCEAFKATTYTCSHTVIMCHKWDRAFFSDLICLVGTIIIYWLCTRI